MGPGRWERTVAAESRSENAMTTRTAAATSLPMRTPEGVRRGKILLRVVGRQLSAIPTGTNSALRSLPSSRSPAPSTLPARGRSEEHTSELQSQSNLVCRLLLEKKKKKKKTSTKHDVPEHSRTTSATRAT